MSRIEDFNLAAILAHYRENDCEFDEAEDGIKEIESGDWELDYKDYAQRSDVYQHIPSGRFFCISRMRSGSYYTDYHYDAPEIYEVYPHVVTRTVYQTKPQEKA